MSHRVIPLSIPEVLLIEPDTYADDRGHFFEGYRKDLLSAYGIDHDFTQDNYSLSKKNVLRGLHFQKAPHAQAKLITCLQGEIYDVAVDIRPESSTYGHWVAAMLTSERHELLYIPEGFAHGFFVHSETALIHYKVSSLYDKASDAGIRWDDPTIAVDWQLSGQMPILSPKDQDLPFFR